MCMAILAPFEWTVAPLCVFFFYMRGIYSNKNIIRICNSINMDGSQISYIRPFD